MSNPALIIVDAQRGFMPLSEGGRLAQEGFGELGVPNGQNIVPYLNTLTSDFQAKDLQVYTTQDWHPEQTAHFSESPNYVTTWPVHCVADTPGAQLHPDLLVAQAHNPALHFKKGMIAAQTPEDDTSYTGYLAESMYGASLPNTLRARATTKLYIGGLALGDGAEHPLCVDSTAKDFFAHGFDVTVITDAAEAVIADNKELCFKNLGKLGVRLMNTAEVLQEIAMLRKEG